jgi:hypothetical protein
MRLDPESLNVQSFSTSDVGDVKTTYYDTGEGGPPSLCFICYNTDMGLPSCPGGKCQADTGPDGPPSQCWICYNTDIGLPTCPGGRC